MGSEPRLPKPKRSNPLLRSRRTAHPEQTTLRKEMSMTDFIPPMPHGDLEEVFRDVFFVTGTTRPKFMGSDWQFSRNMTVVRDGRSLTIVNSVRLDETALGKLDKLGKVENVVKIGAFHGYDDPFYVDRYSAKLWALPGMSHDKDLQTDRELGVGGAMPFSGCSLFVFETADQPEGLILVEREGGILISCDSLQNWSDRDEYFDDSTADRMRMAGFFEPANIGPGWLQSSKPEAKDFVRLKEVAFKHLLSAHGTPLRDEAHSMISRTIRKKFDV